MALLGALAQTATASDAPILAAYRAVPVVDQAASLAVSGDPDRIQEAYDAARDLQEDLRVAGTASARCEALRAALVAFAAARVLEQEGRDRLSPAVRDRGRLRAERARSAAIQARRRCVPGRVVDPPAEIRLTPAPHDAFLGAIVADAPPGAINARVLIDGSARGDVAIRGGRLRTRVVAEPGRHTIAVAFRDADGGVIARAVSSPVHLLPETAGAAVAFSRTSPALASALEEAVSGFDGIAGAWVQDLRGGTGAGANAGALFPAASTVKLGLLVGALGEMRGDPRRSPLFADLRAMATWSSNLGANRVIARLGSGCGTGADALAARGLRRLGARVSTFTGCYIVGTELQPAMALAPGTRQPPRSSRRLASPQDLARMLFSLHAAAVGAPGAAAQTGLSVSRARLALGLLLGSEQAGENRGLFTSALGPGTPVAQKNGWLRRTRLGAAVIYTDRGPLIVALAAHREGGITLAQARRLGERVARAGLD